MRPATNTSGAWASSKAAAVLHHPNAFTSPHHVRAVALSSVVLPPAAEDACRCRLAPVSAASAELEQVAQTATSQLEGGEAAVEEARDVCVRLAESTDEFEQVGWLRARAYYEAKPPSRFQGSFTKQFAEQEARSLLGRTQCFHGSPVPEATCLIAIRDADSDYTVLASADVRPPAATGGRYPDGLPKGDAEDMYGAYILNVVVGTQWRRCGYGRLIMTAAEQHAARQWGAQRAYAHVSLGNKAAWKLYLDMGYETHDSHHGGGDILLCKSL